MKSKCLIHLKNTVMAFNLLDSVRGYLTPYLIERASSHLGEPASGINKAMTAGVPAVLGQFLNRAERGDAQGLLNDAHEAADSNILSNPQSLFSGGIGSFLSGGVDRLQGMFGSNSGGLISSIANFAGIRSSSVQGLLSILAPLGLGVLGRHARENNLSAQGLTSYLSSQRSSIMSALPSGFSAASIFGDRDREERTVIGEDDNVPRTRHMETVPERKKTNLVPLLLLGLGVLALIWFLTRRGADTENENKVATTTNQTPVTTTTTDTHAARATVPTVDMAGRERTNVRLANGQEINAFRGGVEDKLVTCLNEANCAAGKDQWYDFDNINFETGSAQLTAASQQQVQNIAAILNAYPKAKIKIGGYTDKIGNAEANKRLSQQRADAVMNAIKAAGANASQLVGSEGYGSAFAKVDASASDEERRKDRRIAVQLRDK